jgi:hypothetical protein
MEFDLRKTLGENNITSSCAIRFWNGKSESELSSSSTSSSTPSAKKFCTQCGTQLTPGAKFCKECGTKVAV